MKKLFALISTEGKTQKQIAQRVWEAFRKYSKVNENTKKPLEENELKELLAMAKNRREHKK